MANYSNGSFSASPSRLVTGQFLARNHMSKRARARLAARIIAGEVKITDLTDKQIAALCGVSVTYAYAVRGGAPKSDRAERLTKI